MAKNKGLWADVRRDLEAAESNGRLAASRAKSLEQRGRSMPPDARLDRELAIGRLKENCYGAMEAALEKLMKEIDGSTPTEGRSYHDDLIARAADQVEGARPAMIGKEVARDLRRLKSFRNAARHAYGDFDYDRAAPNVKVASRLVSSFASEITAFCEGMRIKDAPSKWNGRGGGVKRRRAKPR